MLFNRGDLSKDHGDYPRAAKLLEESLAVSRAIGYKQVIAYALSLAGGS